MTLVYLFFPCLVVGTGLARAMSATELVDKSNELLRGQSSHARVTMKIDTPRWERTLEVEVWNQGRQRALMRIQAPAKERGNGTLRIDKEIWNWLPAVERVIKIPPSMMQASWMGSDFTFDDMVKADSVVKDYTHSILEEKKEGNRTVYKIEAIPRPDAPVVWGKVLLTISEEEGRVLPVQEEDYSERGEHMRTIRFSAVKELGGRVIPTKLECIPHKKPGQKTTLLYRQFDVDVSFGADFFGLSTLQKPLQ
ncbi:MAG: hypothetical protein A3A86_01675 [Elusimicrobia bacterium RIFCSPLOWO2_01_FULL_60_11]|nr:MAG: hypothetical protein A3A86_01675 [Elusimicrobia bacterium RIFCSPLOWO2_01_FULL_60_11]